MITFNTGELHVLAPYQKKVDDLKAELKTVALGDELNQRRIKAQLKHAEEELQKIQLMLLEQRKRDIDRFRMDLKPFMSKLVITNEPIHLKIINGEYVGGGNKNMHLRLRISKTGSEFSTYIWLGTEVDKMLLCYKLQSIGVYDKVKSNFHPSDLIGTEFIGIVQSDNAYSKFEITEWFHINDNLNTINTKTKLSQTVKPLSVKAQAETAKVPETNKTTTYLPSVEATRPKGPDFAR